LLHTTAGLLARQLFAPFLTLSDSRMSGAPFALFPRIILPPVFSRADSGPTTLSSPVHTDDQQGGIILGRCNRTPRDFYENADPLLFFSGDREAKFAKTFQKARRLWRKERLKVN
jgi:hypothetical protein